MKRARRNVPGWRAAGAEIREEENEMLTPEGQGSWRTEAARGEGRGLHGGGRRMQEYLGPRGGDLLVLLKSFALCLLAYKLCDLELVNSLSAPHLQ